MCSIINYIIKKSGKRFETKQVAVKFCRKHERKEEEVSLSFTLSHFFSGALASDFYRVLCPLSLRSF